MRAVRDEIQIECVLVNENGVLVKVVGEVDMSTAPALEEALVALDGSPTTIDLTEVPFMDSTGLHVLVSTHKRVVERGGSLRITGLQSSVQRAFAVTGLNEYLEVG